MPSDAYLKAVTIGAVERLDGPVALQEYDPAWPEQVVAEILRHIREDS